MDLIDKIKDNKTIVNGSLFSLFSFINQGIAFLLLILLASYIAPAEYGRLSLFNTIVQFMGYFIALSTQGYLSISYFKRGPKFFKQDFSTICFICLVVTLFFSFMALLAGKWVAKQASLPISFIWFAIIISFFQIFQVMWLDYYRIHEKVSRYGLISCSSAILNLVLSLYLVIGAGLDWEGRVYANVICVFLIGCVAILYFGKHHLYTKDVTLYNIKRISIWGIPLIPHLASVWIKQGGDRFIINYYHTVEDIGLFSFALNLTSIIIIIGSAFNSSNSVSIFKILSENSSIENKKKLLRNQTRNITMITLLGSLLVVLGVFLLVPIALPRYINSLPYFLILSLQGIGQCFYFLFCNYLFYYSKNNRIMLVTFGTSILHLCLSLVLTRYSLYYTCIIYVITQILINYLIYIMSRKVLSSNLSNNL